ncbi:unnamed protein product [Ranitomeya imitator]|uniref:Pre-mRNA-processing factor 39 n=1 Tax=Ranitomeya imitator TaxID=111125 RepID=A0ABN9LQN6_9NEOB|nr:unnamed protein product [Ranitomeya imitator]
MAQGLHTDNVRVRYVFYTDPLTLMDPQKYCANMQDPKPDPSPVTKEEKAAEAPTEASQPNKDNADILEVTAMEQSPEQDNTSGVEEAAEAPEKQEPEQPYPPEFDKYWKAVEANPEDFTTWTYMLHYIEQENHIFAIRRVFDMFLTRYPYCYGYWKKYADLEKRSNNVMEADEVYRRGIQAVTLSVDLWIHYLQFLKETLDPADPETCNTLRGTFEHAIMSAGLDFRSDKLWEMYITYEAEQGNLSGVTSIYSRLLGIPTQQYTHHFQHTDAQQRARTDYVTAPSNLSVIARGRCRRSRSEEQRFSFPEKRAHRSQRPSWDTHSADPAALLQLSYSHPSGPYIADCPWGLKTQETWVVPSGLSNNATAVAYINRQGGTRSKAAMTEGNSMSSGPVVPTRPSPILLKIYKDVHVEKIFEIFVLDCRSIAEVVDMTNPIDES